MIINDKKAAARLDSPINLINQIAASRVNGNNGNKRQSAMGLFGLQSSKQNILATLPVKEAAITPAAVTAPVIEPEIIKPFTNPFKQFEYPSAAASLALSKTSLPVQHERSEAPTLDSLLNDSEHQIKLSLAHDTALTLLTNSVSMLAAKLDDVKADKLPAVISAASKTVESIRRERLEVKKSGTEKEVHYHFYTPTQKKISDYEVIEVQ